MTSVQEMRAECLIAVHILTGGDSDASIPRSRRVGFGKHLKNEKANNNTGTSSQRAESLSRRTTTTLFRLVRSKAHPIKEDDDNNTTGKRVSHSTNDKTCHTT